MKKLFLMLLTVSVSVSFLASCSGNDKSVLSGESESISVSTSDIGNGGQSCYSPPKSYSYEELAKTINDDNREFPCDSAFLKIAETITMPDSLKFYYYRYIVWPNYDENYNAISLEIAWKPDDTSEFCGTMVLYYPDGGWKPYKGFEQIQDTKLWRDGDNYSYWISEFYECGFTTYDGMIDFETGKDMCLLIEEIINDHTA